MDADETWVDMLSSLRSLRNPPEVVVITDGALEVDNVVSMGAYDAMRRPLTSADLVWSIATAWHAWMKRFEQREGCG